MFLLMCVREHVHMFVHAVCACACVCVRARAGDLFQIRRLLKL